MPFNDELYDAIYCYNTLHLFLREERIKILKKCYNQLKANGFLFFVVFFLLILYNTFYSKDV